MIHYIRGQKGSVVVIAIGFMLILGLFITTLLPYLSSVTRTSKMSQDQARAQFAAEAGAKRAIASFGKFSAQGGTPGKATDWDWIGVNTSVLGAADTTGGTYNVTLNNSADANSTFLYNPANAGGTFTYGVPITITIKSIGTFKEGTDPAATEAFLVTVPISTGGQVNYNAISWNKTSVKTTSK